jgi:NTF2 fold immunity protein
MSRIAIVVAVALLAFGSAAADKPPWIPKNGFVPNAETAMRIAEAVWIPIYGKKLIEGEKPFTAELKDETWIVRGRRPVDKGGTAVAEIAKLDGRILRVVHTQ